MPTEDQREKACRGGIEDADYAWGNEPPNQVKYFQGEWTGPKRVGEWHANGYGLFNIGDNVHEWCMDWYAENYYAVSPNKNPAGPQTGTRRVSRGGSWRHQIKASRAAHRSSLPPEYQYTDYGFRIVSSNSGTDVPELRVSDVAAAGANGCAVTDANASRVEVPVIRVGVVIAA